jgi:arginyl-tRNA synthetase
MTTLHERIRGLLSLATQQALAAGVLPQALAPREIQLERPRQASHGDMATNLCFALAKAAGKNPRALADAFAPIVRAADTNGWLEAVDVAGPGFLNLRLSDLAWQASVTDVLVSAGDFGLCKVGGGERVLLEFVSANPTGPMHVGHGRGAVLGDTLARVMRAAGFDVTTEYYINNVGNQVGKLGESVWCWLREPEKRAAALAIWAKGDPVPFPESFPEGFPEDGYRGAYIAQCAADLAEAGVAAPACAWADDAAWLAGDPASLTGRADNRTITVGSWQRQLDRIRDDLGKLDIQFDSWFSERRLHGLDPESGDAVKDVAKRLVAADWAYEDASQPADDEDAAPAGKAIFFKGTSEDLPKQFRDGKDRVIIRGDGRPTYFAADIAYHDDKLARGFDHLINIWGADHHGYVARLKGVIEALGKMRGDARWTGDRLEVILVQMVALLRDGKPVPMGKRSGEFVTLRDVIDEVTTGEPSSGRDAVRFLFLLRKADAQLDFDLEVARRTSMDNPVYYVQYGHARLCSILEKAEKEGRLPAIDALPAALQLADERELALACADLPEVIARAAKAREPHQVAYYLTDLARSFNGYYSRHKHDARVIGDDDAETHARLQLVRALKQVIGNGLRLLGVSAPERMATLPDVEPEA